MCPMTNNTKLVLNFLPSSSLITTGVNTLKFKIIPYITK